MHERITAIVNGESDKPLPDDDELIEYGTTLFNTLFPGDVRRLYDVARSIHPEQTLNVILTFKKNDPDFSGELPKHPR